MCDCPTLFHEHAANFLNPDLRSEQAPFEFHVSRKARERYQFDLSLFSTTGNIIFANFQAARLFAFQMNRQRDIGEPTVSAAELSAMGLIDEILHHILWQYRQTQNPNVFADAQSWLEERYGQASLEALLLQFVEEFPPLDVYLNQLTPEEYLRGNTGKTPNTRIALEELIMLRLANLNPAFSKYKELFDDAPLKEQTIYQQAVDSLEEFFEDQPFFDLGKGASNLLQVLRTPAQQVPHSLEGQLQFLQQEYGVFLDSVLNSSWRELLGKSFQETWGTGLEQEYQVRLLRSLDYLEEEQKMRFDPGLGPAPTEVPDFHWQEEEFEQFSPDTDWMPRLVLMAKSTLVWLDQLSKTYQREITRLDQIPDEELDRLARGGFTGLWLIGIWERSPASQKIKQMTGNPEASASAYSLYDYQVAAELGGEAALQNLKERCWQRGIRLASDMVPNHTGIVSRWVLEHPEWYVQLPYPPFPAYTFSGTDLSPDPDISIYLEDHYYDRSDAAVVFKWVDRRSGEVRYIYHGNDGTSMPWNDTAQLDYLQAAVREAVIRTIIDVARKTPIIRFDAAMTLARRHFQRLWYPAPGSGGDIPSRSEHGLTRAQMEQLMPIEFWREVVDRVAEEAPDTLLLAEAFWLMEGYFVRTLGMHRVYNSAFMNMLQNEENQKYRETIKNTIEFDPEILKRYVNFMNNPDEDSAIDQFGDGDKYFGVCTLLATMPGLPMFGHGQIEGYREKYGMEYRRAYLDEQPNSYLVERHEREIFPLLKKRYLFAEVEHFLLYDFYREDGSVNENVFAYSNRFGNERALVVYHNAYEYTEGWVKTSAAFLEKGTHDGQRRLVQYTIGEGLALSGHDQAFCIFRDYISGLEYIHSCRTLQEEGLHLELGGYKYRVFLNFREVWDDGSGQYRQLAESLNGRGVPSIEEARQELYLQPLHNALREVLKPAHIDPLRKTAPATLPRRLANSDLLPLLAAYRKFLSTALDFGDFSGTAGTVAKKLEKDIAALLLLTRRALKERYPLRGNQRYGRALARIDRALENHPALFPAMLLWCLLRHLELLEPQDSHHTSLALAEDWLLLKVARASLRQMGHSQEETDQALSMVRLMMENPKWMRWPLRGKSAGLRLLREIFSNHSGRLFLKTNLFDNLLWFNREAFATLREIVFLGNIISALAAGERPASAWQQTGKNSGKRSKPAQIEANVTQVSKMTKLIQTVFEIVEDWQKAEKSSQYQVKMLIEKMKTSKTTRVAAPPRRAKKASLKARKKPVKKTPKKDSDSD